MRKIRLKIAYNITKRQNPGDSNLMKQDDRLCNCVFKWHTFYVKPCEEMLAIWGFDRLVLGGSGSLVYDNVAG